MTDISAISAAAPSGAEGQIILLTLSVAARAVLFGLPVAIILALALNRLFAPGRLMLNVLVNLPLMLPPVVTGWLLLLLFGRHGPAGIWLASHLNVHLPFTTAGAVLACMVMTLPLMVRAIRQGFDLVDPGLLEAAKTLGAGPVDRFNSITLPIAAPGILAGMAIAFTACIGEFGAVITFAASIPGETQTLPLAIFASLSRPDGEALAMHLSLYAIALATLGFVASEFAMRKLRR